jgi:ABC-type transporter Mla subunit MlaD
MTTTIDDDMAELITLHKTSGALANGLADAVKGTRESLVSLQTNVERIEDAVNEGLPAVQEAIENLRADVRATTELRAAVLADHRDNHAEISPRFCFEACRLAAEDW